MELTKYTNSILDTVKNKLIINGIYDNKKKSILNYILYSITDSKYFMDKYIYGSIHNLEITKNEFEMYIRGYKNIEVLIYKEYWKENDIVIIYENNNGILTGNFIISKINKIEKFKDFYELINKCDYKKVLPQANSIEEAIIFFDHLNGIFNYYVMAVYLELLCSII